MEVGCEDTVQCCKRSLHPTCIMEGGSGSRRRRTRSQVGPEWSSKEALILVNEVSSVEADFSKALSSYQKWKMISENCMALDVPRSANQCRRKWDSLLDEYKMVVGSRTYCNSESESFPPNFDRELFKAIDDFVMAKDNQSDTDPDSDPEAKAETEAIAELGSQRQTRQSMRVKQYAEQKLLKSKLQEKDQKSGGAEEKLCNSHVDEKPQKGGHAEKKPQNSGMEENIATSTEENEQLMVVKLHENAELIHAIVADFNNTQYLQSEFVRRQGDKLIACLGEIVNTLNQL